jgi:O-antigen/teichoic acid export membrane protein
MSEQEQVVLTRASVLRSGMFLALRHGIDAPLGLVGESLMARWIGPSAYGLWIGASRCTFYIASVSSLSLGQYLLRKRSEPDRVDYDQAFSLLLFTGLTACVLSAALAARFAPMLGIGGVAPVAIAFLLAVPVTIISAVPRALLERAMRHREVAAVEAGAKCIFYVVACGLSFLGWGIAAVVLGFWLQQIVLAMLLYTVAAYRPRLVRNAAVAREMVGWGLKYSAANWIMQARSLVNPLIVGEMYGVAVVGYVGLAERMVSALCFFGAAAWRLSMVVLAKMNSDRKRIARAVSEGMELQVLSRAPLLIAGSIALAYLLVPLFGPRWRPVVDIYPFIAAAALFHGLFILHESALFAVGDTRAVAAFHAVHVVVFALAVLLLTRRMGWLGYGWAEFAVAPAYAMLHRSMITRIGSVDYHFSGALVCAAAMALFWRQLGLIAMAGLALVAIWPLARRATFDHLMHLCAAMREA